MKRNMSGLIIMILLGMLLTGCVQKQQEQQPPVKTKEDVSVDIVTLLMENNFTGVYDFFNTSITSQITADDFANIWTQQIGAPNGNITRIVRTRSTNESGYSVVYVTCNFSKVTVLDVKISFNTYEKVVALVVVPTLEAFDYSPPSYVDQLAFTEQNVSFGSEPWKLPATLTIPNGAGPFPAVLLVHGSGPNDRDETYGPNKPFKDIALGLASRGIVVLRYEKRTKQYPKEFAKLQNFTVQDETIADAEAGVNFLYASSIVDHSKIFVLGHSLGGMLAPRIALQNNHIKGLIIMAGPTRHLEDLILEQSRYLANQSGLNQSAKLAELERLVIKVKNLDMNQSEFILGAPKSYWVDLVTYDPVETAQLLDIPLLILQGDRDYQVTMTDFVRWNETFNKNSSVTLKIYPSLNHFFIAGTGVPTNAEYLIEGHVAEAVISDIASWITTQ
ncbi:MAG TPA: prolyl oligopeptidase family serine peptidase [Candidatus Thermoplasmatota archaeon]|nr:prolyl oligopeptidase family serine peptidase [Candidatus Thermoplasmatota archaeon]